MPLLSSQRKRKRKQNPYKVRKEKKNKIKLFMSKVSHNNLVVQMEIPQVEEPLTEMKKS